MDSFLHILGRFIIHFFSSFSLVVIGFFALKFLAKKVPEAQKFLSPTFEHLVVLAALLVFTFSTLREAYDVSKGQALTKAFFDYASWLLGTGCSAFGLYRIINLKR